MASALCLPLQVWLFQPIALDAQARELLRAGSFEQALALADTCAADGAPWAETAFAEAAFLLMQGRLASADATCLGRTVHCSGLMRGRHHTAWRFFKTVDLCCWYYEQLGARQSVHRGRHGLYDMSQCTPAMWLWLSSCTIAA